RDRERHFAAQLRFEASAYCFRKRTHRYASVARHALLVCDLLRGPRSIEVSQIRRRLILLDRHQEAIGAQEVVFLADDNVNIIFSTDVLSPPDWLVRRYAAVILDDRPGARQRIVDRGDFIMEKIEIGFVEINPFPDDGPTVLVERNAARIVGA